MKVGTGTAGLGPACPRRGCPTPVNRPDGQGGGQHHPDERGRPARAPRAGGAGVAGAGPGPGAACAAARVGGVGVDRPPGSASPAGRAGPAAGSVVPDEDVDGHGHEQQR